MCEIGNYRSFAYKLLGKFVAVDQNIGGSKPSGPTNIMQASQDKQICV